MEFYIQAAIDLELDELFYVAKGTKPFTGQVADLPTEDFYGLDGLEEHVPGEEPVAIPYEERHVIRNYKVSGDYECFDESLNALSENKELSFQDCECEILEVVDLPKISV